jgi:hypothetical protein
MAESIALRQEIGDVATIAESRLQLAKVALEQGQTQEAESLARTACEALDGQKAISDAARPMPSSPWRCWRKEKMRMLR